MDIPSHFPSSAAPGLVSVPPLVFCVCVASSACGSAAMFSCYRYFPSLPVPNFPVSWERRTGEAYELLVEDRIEERDLELAEVMETEESE